jgi:NADH-quinone oxidoreductase subunit F
MDKRLGGGPATPEELAALDGVIGPGDPPDLLLPALHALNDRVGWISPGGLDEICRRLDVAPATAFGVASFYAMFSTEPRPPSVAYVCDDVPCRMAGALERIATLPVAPEGWTWERSPCLGQCDRAPAVLTTGPPVADVTQLQTSAPEPAGLVPSNLPLLRRVGRVDPTDIDAYGPFEGLRRARTIGPEAVIAEITASGLIGRGGAAFPAGAKWAAVAAAADPVRHLVCNADESETGTFKDRVLLESDPFAVLEGMAIAAFACGVTKSYVYLRGEYPLAHERMTAAIAQVRAREGLDIELRRGAGAYICGEETALFNSLEGHRGEPRSKPPFPTVAGLFGRPTVVHNVETLANVPVILGGRRPDTKLFSLCGHVERPGVYEVSLGTPLRTLVEELGGGVAGGRSLQAIQCGGAAGTFLTPADLDLPLTFEDLRARGATIGSGAVVVIDDTVDLRDVVRRTAAFFAHESCGQCVPCRVGTVRQVELLDRPGSRALLEEVAQVMRDASICGLGHTASNLVLSAIKEFDL